MKCSSVQLPFSSFNYYKARNGNIKTLSQVSKKLDNLIKEKVCIGINLEAASFWNNFEEIIKEFSPKNRELLNIREDLQSKIDDLHGNIGFLKSDMK